MIYFEVTIAIHHVYLVFYQHHYINFNTHHYLNFEKLGKHPNQNTANIPFMFFMVLDHSIQLQTIKYLTYPQ